VIDVDDHDTPVEVLSLDPGAGAMDVAVGQRLAYVGLGGAARAVGVWDFDHPLQPVELVTVPMAGPVRSLSLHGGLLLVGCEGSLEVLDLADPAAPVSLGSLALAGAVTDIAASGDRAVVEHGGDASLVDLADPTMPALLTTLPRDAHFTVTSVALRDGVAWIGSQYYDFEGDLRWFDLTGPAAPVEIGRYALPAWPAALSFTHDEAFVGCVDISGAGGSFGRLEVFRDGDLASARAGFLDLSADQLGFGDGAPAGDWFYIVGFGDLSVVSIADLAAPTVAGSLWMGPAVGQVAAMAGAWLVVSLRHWTE